jgi:DinB family protein
MSDRTPFPTIATELQQTIDAALPKLRAISDADAARPCAIGKWSPKQVIGHLIDSASNNHQRFVRAQQGTELAFPPYAQEHWVACQHYADRPWDEIVTLWHAYNGHLVHVIRHIPEEKRNAPCVIESTDPVTLGFLADDYGAHLRHHLAQVGVVI